MGLFSRKPATIDSRPRLRPSVYGEAQARALRVRARRRLIGALALVLAVVLVVPMLFDTSTPHPPESIIVVPMVVTPAVDDPLTQVPDNAGTSEAGVIITTENTVPPAPQPDTQTATNTQASAPQPPSAQPPSTTPAHNPTANRPTNAADPQTRPTARAPSRAPATDRTDDGSVALALLEGRQPPGTTSNRFVLQVAAYATQQDALARRDQLVQAGITNVLVQTARLNGKDTYRVRVGPFSTRDAAQAAQARIRSLGDYPDAFITVQ